MHLASHRPRATAPARRPLAVALTVLLTAGLMVPAPVARADGKSGKSWLDKKIAGGLDSAGSFALQLALNALASGLYSGFCDEDQVVDPLGDILCSAIGGHLGKDEEKWRADLLARLDKLEAQGEAILAGQEQIRRAIDAQNDAIRKAIDSLPAKLQVHDDLTNIQAAWARLRQFFHDHDPQTPEQSLVAIRALAKELRNNPKYNVEASALDLRLAIAPEAPGLESIALLLAKELEAWHRTRFPIDTGYDDPAIYDVRPLYGPLELAMQQWLIAQKQAQVLSLWVARVLEGTPDAPPSTVREQGKAYFRSVETQLEAFQRAVEWLVLGNSSPVGPFADFLPAGAVEVFARADAFQAVHLAAPTGVGTSSPGQAIWGRVIAMGEGPGGSLSFRPPGQGVRAVPAASHRTLPTRGFPELDWWTASDAKHPQVYDVVHFANAWKVYRYRMPLADRDPLGVYALRPGDPGNALPVLPASVTVDDSLRAITGRSSRFGTFVGIARAGGAYALFSGEYDTERKEQWGDIARLEKRGAFKVLKKISEVDRSRGTMPRLAVGEDTKTLFVKAEFSGPVNAAEPFSVERSNQLHVQSKKRIRSADGARVHLHVRWQEKPLAAPRLSKLDTEPLAVDHTWSVPLPGGKPAKHRLEATLLFTVATMGVPSQGLILRLTGEKAGANADALARGRDDHDVIEVFLPTQGAYLRLSGEVALNLPRDGREVTWQMLSAMPIQTAYLSR